jgi:hypothetical protein
MCDALKGRAFLMVGVRQQRQAPGAVPQRQLLMSEKKKEHDYPASYQENDSWLPGEMKPVSPAQQARNNKFQADLVARIKKAHETNAKIERDKGK